MLKIEEVREGKIETQAHHIPVRFDANYISEDMVPMGATVFAYGHTFIEGIQDLIYALERQQKGLASRPYQTWYYTCGCDGVYRFYSEGDFD